MFVLVRLHLAGARIRAIRCTDVRASLCTIRPSRGQTTAQCIMESVYWQLVTTAKERWAMSTSAAEIWGSHAAATYMHAAFFKGCFMMHVATNHRRVKSPRSRRRACRHRGAIRWGSRRARRRVHSCGRDTWFGVISPRLGDCGGKIHHEPHAQTARECIFTFTCSS